MSQGGRRRRQAGAVLAAGVLVVALLLAGCSSDGEDQLTVAAASSLRPAFGDPGEVDPGGGPVRFTFGGSDLLAGQIRQGAGIDVIAAASTIQPDQLFEDGLVERPVEFAGNRLVVGVPDDSAIDSVEDIAGPGVSVVVGDASVPIGIYAREMISMLPAATAEKVRANVRSQEQDATSITAKLTQGAADAGIVYETDVESASGQLRAVGIPERLQPRIAYSAAVVSDSDQKQRATDFIESLLDGERAAELEAAGLLPPPGAQ
jgi:molybdate transport system substrate-binding protein